MSWLIKVSKDASLTWKGFYYPSLPLKLFDIHVSCTARLPNTAPAHISIGTTGTGGMGMNIPYTHSEDKPSMFYSQNRSGFGTLDSCFYSRERQMLPW